jgi:hypothetical protein
MEQYKSQKWENAWNHVKNGNIVAAGHELAGLFTNPYAADQMDLTKGFAEGAGQAVTTAADLIHKILPAAIANTTGAEAWRTPEMRQKETPVTSGEKAGSTIETIGEFILTDGLAAGLPLGDAILKSKKISEALEASPKMIPWVKAVMATGRVAAVSAAQSAAHAPEGERGAAAVQGAEFGAAGGALGETLGAGARYFSAKTPEAIAALATDDANAEFLRNQQAAFQQGKKASDLASYGLNNVAGEVADSITGGPSKTDQLLRDNGSYTFKDAANAIYDHAKPVFEEVDNISDNEFSALREKQKTAFDVIRNSSSMTAVNDAKQSLAETNQKIGQIFEDAGDKILSDPKSSQLTLADLREAQDNWRKASTIEELHSGLDRAFTYPEAAQKLAGRPASINPAKFKAQLDSAVRSIGQDRLADALGDQAVTQLYDISDGVSKMLDNAKFNKAAQSYVNSYLNRALAAMPKPSGASTLSYGISPIIGGATIGAGVGALNADTDQRTEGALKGAMVGGLAGGAASVPVGLAHWFYTHPAVAVKAFEFASKVAPAASQAAKKYAGVTHVYSPEDGSLTPVAPAQ